MKPFYRFTKLSDPCQCGSGHPYRTCCFRGELIGFIIAMILLAGILSLPSESIWSRILRGIVAVGTSICIVALLREWLIRKRAGKKEDKHA